LEIRRAEIRRRLAVFVQAPFALHAVEQGRRRRGLQDAGHGPRDGRALDELQLAIEDGLVVGIEADDEAAQHPQAAFLDRGSAVALSARRFWNFFEPFSASADGVSMPMKTYMKFASTMAASSPRGRPDRWKPPCRTRRGSRSSATPVNSTASSSALLAVADEVVVDDEHLVAPAESAQRVEFPDQLRWRFERGLRP
jgi:hypothetical protein